MADWTVDIVHVDDHKNNLPKVCAGQTGRHNFSNMFAVCSYSLSDGPFIGKTVRHYFRQIRFRLIGLISIASPLLSLTHDTEEATAHYTVHGSVVQFTYFTISAS